MNLKKKRILVTGSNGFVGTYMMSYLQKESIYCHGVVRDVKLKPFYIFSIGDVCDYRFCERVINTNDIDVVIHLAAHAIVGQAARSPIGAFRTNIQGTWNILEASRVLGNLDCILIVSTDKVYGEQMNAKEDGPLFGLGSYDVSKRCADLVAQSYAYNYDLPIVVTRACNIYGYDENSRIIPNTIRAILRNERPIIFKNDESSREYIYVEDVIDAYLSLIRNIEKTRGNVYNVGSGEVYTQEEIVKKIIELMDRNVEPRYVEKTPDFKEIKKQSLNSNKIFKEIGWKAKYSLEEGLKKTIKEFEKKFNYGK